jgi:hypothetical protein
MISGKEVEGDRLEEGLVLRYSSFKLVCACFGWSLTFCGFEPYFIELHSLIPRIMASLSTLTRSQFEQASKALIDKHTHHSTDFPLNPTILKGWSWTEHPVCTFSQYINLF